MKTVHVLLACLPITLTSCSSSDEPAKETADSAVTTPESGADTAMPAVDSESPADTTPTKDASASTGAPFATVDGFATTLAKDPADVWYPKPADLATKTYSFPVVLVIQGANVDKGAYASFAKQVAGFGFTVVVPNHNHAFFGMSGLYGEQSEVTDAKAWAAAENARSGSPLAGKLDVTKLALVAHSFGGVVGLGAVAGTCSAPFCTGTFKRPDELKAAVFWGTNLKSPTGGAIPATDNGPVAVGFLQGTVDGKALPADGKATYDNVKNAPKAYLTVVGANHYGINDTNNPTGAAADSSAPTLPQAQGTAIVARSAGLMLRAWVLGEASALTTLASDAAAADSHLTFEKK